MKRTIRMVVFVLVGLVIGLSFSINSARADRKGYVESACRTDRAPDDNFSFSTVLNLLLEVCGDNAAEKAAFIEVCMHDNEVSRTRAECEAYLAEEDTQVEDVQGEGEVVDTDEDGIEDLEDNCPDDANADQADEDEDGIGDECDVDSADNNNSGGNNGLTSNGNGAGNGANQPGAPTADPELAGNPLGDPNGYTRRAAAGESTCSLNAYASFGYSWIQMILFAVFVAVIRVRKSFK